MKANTSYLKICACLLFLVAGVGCRSGDGREPFSVPAEIKKLVPDIGRRPYVYKAGTHAVVVHLDKKTGKPISGFSRNENHSSIRLLVITGKIWSVLRDYKENFQFTSQYGMYSKYIGLNGSVRHHMILFHSCGKRMVFAQEGHYFKWKKYTAYEASMQINSYVFVRYQYFVSKLSDQALVSAHVCRWLGLN